MKTKPFIATVAAGFAALLGAPTSAIEAPADDAPPPRIMQPAPEAPPAKLPPATAETPLQVVPPPATRTPAPSAVKPAPKAQPAFLGVISSALPAMLADHLGLKNNGGIIVQALCPPDGPAAKAGVAVHDVITSIGQQPVTSSQDLTKAVAAHQPGDKVHLDLIHHGKATGIDVTLDSRPDELAAIDPHPLDHLNLEGIPKELAERVRRAIECNLGGIDMDVQDGALEIAPKMRELKKRMEQALEGMNGQLIPGDLPRIDIQQGATFRMMDDHGSIELKSNEGNKEITVRDKDNKIVWNGPWDTAQDKAAAPEDVRQRVERLHLDTQFHGNGLRLHLGAPQAHDPP